MIFVGPVATGDASDAGLVPKARARSFVICWPSPMCARKTAQGFDCKTRILFGDPIRSAAAICDAKQCRYPTCLALPLRQQFATENVAGSTRSRRQQRGSLIVGPRVALHGSLWSERPKRCSPTKSDPSTSRVALAAIGKLAVEAREQRRVLIERDSRTGINLQGIAPGPRAIDREQRTRDRYKPVGD
jgi:hypothetical protein